MSSSPGNTMYDTSVVLCEDYKDELLKIFTDHQGLTDFFTVSKKELPTSYSSREGLVINICNYERVGNVLTG